MFACPSNKRLRFQLKCGVRQQVNKLIVMDGFGRECDHIHMRGAMNEDALQGALCKLHAVQSMQPS